MVVFDNGYWCFHFCPGRQFEELEDLGVLLEFLFSEKCHIVGTFTPQLVEYLRDEMFTGIGFIVSKPVTQYICTLVVAILMFLVLIYSKPQNFRFPSQCNMCH